MKLPFKGVDVEPPMREPHLTSPLLCVLFHLQEFIDMEKGDGGYTYTKQTQL